MTMYQIQVPSGVGPGDTFQADIAGQMMIVTCPPQASAGSTIQVAGPEQNVPTVTGVPVSQGMQHEVVQGAVFVDGVHHVHPGAGVYVESPQMVEVDEISPAGWFCLIAGCFFCPGLNLLGICMRERRLVPASHIHAYYH